MQRKIGRCDPIQGTDPSGVFSYKLDFSLPFVAVALHSGHHVREELLPFMALDSGQREIEEDTATDVMIQDLGNVVWALESRAVYDLNRSPDAALPLGPAQFWGKQVYKASPSSEMNQKSLERYASFYTFMEMCIKSILDRFNICIVYDIHSYNILRQQDKGIESPPVFNLGTALLDTSKWGKAIALWLEQLNAIPLPGIRTTVAENLVFSGNAEFCRRLCRLDDRILVLPTEVSKVYMDEVKGNVYPEVVKALKKGLGKAVLSHVALLKKSNCF